MNPQPIEYSASVDMAASAESVWALVADVTRIGEWSPECVRAEWNEGHSAPAVGAVFTGTNQVGDFEWSVPCQVVECEPGKVFAFVAPATMDDDTHRTVWRYEFHATDTGCRVTESFHAPLLNVEGSPSNFAGRYEMLCAAVSTTLEHLRAAVEQ